MRDHTTFDVRATIAVTHDTLETKAGELQR